MGKIKEIIYFHKFFVTESRFFCGKIKNPYLRNALAKPDTKVRKELSKYYKLDLKHKLYYPIAYIKFMYYSLLK